MKGLSINNVREEDGAKLDEKANSSKMGALAYFDKELTDCFLQKKLTESDEEGRGLKLSKTWTLLLCTAPKL